MTGCVPAGCVPTVGHPPEAMPGHVPATLGQPPSAIPSLMFTFSVVGNTIYATLERDMRLAGKQVRDAGFTHNRAVFIALFACLLMFTIFRLKPGVRLRYV